MAGEQAMALAKKTNFKRGEALALTYLGRLYESQSNPVKALKFLYDALQIEQAHQYPAETALSLNFIAGIYQDLQDDSTAKDYLLKAEKISQETNLFWQLALDLNTATAYKNLNQIDSAFIYIQKAKNELLGSPIAASSTATYLAVYGEIQFKLGNHEVALQSMRESLSLSEDPGRAAIVYNNMAEFFKEMNQPDSAIFYATYALEESKKVTSRREILKATELLAELYEPKDLKRALYYQKRTNLLRDDLFGIKKIQGLQRIITDEQQREREVEVKRTSYQNKVRQFTLLAGLFLLFLFAFFIFRYYLSDKKAKNLLREKNKVIEQTLTNL
jgi:tetratricopeptide (TPR) repeat protein